MINTLKKHIKEISKAPVVGLDIETITTKDGDEWKVAPFEIGLYDPKSKSGLTIYVNPFYWNNLTRKDEAMFFYQAEKYKFGKGYTVTAEELQEVFADTQFNTLYGHNILKFDIPHLQNWGVSIKAKRIVDTFLEAGGALPLKYYTTLRQWQSQRDDYKFFTEKGNLRMTAEAIYCFISNNPDFKESHTAEEDCRIEYEIFKYQQKRIAVGKKVEGNWKTVLADFFGKFKTIGVK